jgi:hypothetical protein
MSYILDALNKADNKRKMQTPTPSPATPITIAPKHTSSSTWRWLITLLVVMGALFWWLYQDNPQPTQALTSHKPNTKNVEIKPSSVPQAIITNQAERPLEHTATLMAEPQPIPHLFHLDKSVREQLPTIIISAHIYSDNPKKRMVIINNSVVHEGAKISDKLYLKSIDLQGITLSFAGTLFTMKVKDVWQPR